MADERDPKISQGYRELGAEEPPRALDAKILAASRRAVDARPAPLVAPTGRRRWYVPLAAAAVITLAVAVTLHVQHDRPGEEVDAVSPSMSVQETPAPKSAAPAAREERRAPQPFAGSPRQDSTVAPAPAPASPPAAAEKSSEQSSEMAAAPSSGARASRGEPPRAQSQMARAAAELSPEGQLERIAQLRAAGRHEEADKALAEFRKRYPDYRLSDEMKAKVEKRQ